MYANQYDSSDPAIRATGCAFLDVGKMIEILSKKTLTDKDIVAVATKCRSLIERKPWWDKDMQVVGNDMSVNDWDKTADVYGEIVDLKGHLRCIGQSDVSGTEFWGYDTEEQRDYDFIMKCYITEAGGTHWVLLSKHHVGLYDSFPATKRAGIKKEMFFKYIED